MARVVLLGSLRKEFGGPFTFDTTTVRGAISGLIYQLKGFRKKMHGGAYRVVYRRGKFRRDMTTNDFGIQLFSDSEVWIVPVPHGGGNKGTGKAIIGAVILVAAIYAAPAVATVATAGETAAGAAFGASMAASTGIMGVTYGQIAGFGAMMFLSGVYQMFTGTSSTTRTSSPEANASSIFTGPVSSVAQGEARPLVFGRFICGSHRISTDFYAERVL